MTISSHNDDTPSCGDGFTGYHTRGDECAAASLAAAQSQESCQDIPLPPAIVIEFANALTGFITREQQQWCEMQDAYLQNVEEWHNVCRHAKVIADFPMSQACADAHEQEARTQIPVWVGECAAAAGTLLQSLYDIQTGFWITLIQGLPGLTEGMKSLLCLKLRQTALISAPAMQPAFHRDTVAHTLRCNGDNIAPALERVNRELGKDPGLSLSPLLERTCLERNSEPASCPGYTVMRNRRMELLHFPAATTGVYAHPLLIIPSWLNRYYVFDLSRQRSFIRYATRNGIDVYVISWRNPMTAGDADGYLAYLEEGASAALNFIRGCGSNTRVNLMGYCLGGVMALGLYERLLRLGHHELIAGITLAAVPFAADDGYRADFLLHRESLHMLKERFCKRGVIPGEFLHGLFTALCGQELFRSGYLDIFWADKPKLQSDILAWSADCINVPLKLHEDILDNVLIGDRRDPALPFITATGAGRVLCPVFAVGCARDRIVPWESAFAACAVNFADTVFALSDGGHVSGVMTGLSDARCGYLHAGTEACGADAHQWQRSATACAGSWWPLWLKTLREKGCLGVTGSGACAARQEHPDINGSREPAPGTYVFL